MKKQFSIFLLIFFVSANINAEISGVRFCDFSQLYNHQIMKSQGVLNEKMDKLNFRWR